MSGDAAYATFSPDASKLYSTGSDGQIYIWDIGTRKCIHRYIDDGCLQGTTLAISPNGKYQAAGSNSGVVNIYNLENDHILNSTIPKPIKNIMNITTSISNIAFNSDSQLLAMTSRKTKDCMKLVHMPSLTVYQNWPTQQTPLNYVTSIDFSPNSGYMAIGNQKGKALLYKLTHYNSS